MSLNADGEALMNGLEALFAAGSPPVEAAAKPLPEQRFTTHTDLQTLWTGKPKNQTSVADPAFKLLSQSVAKRKAEKVKQRNVERQRKVAAAEAGANYRDCNLAVTKQSESVVAAEGAPPKQAAHSEDDDELFFVKGAEDLNRYFDVRPVHDTPQAEVKLNVYIVPHLEELHLKTKHLGLGTWHTGIEVYDNEYAYGYHEDDDTGIYRCDPRGASNFDFHKTLELGSTNFTEEEVIRLLSQTEPGWVGNEYDIVGRNCNHFSNFLSQILTGSKIPNYLNRLAEVGNDLVQLFGLDSAEFLYPNGPPKQSTAPLPRMKLSAEDCEDLTDFNSQAFEIFARKGKLGQKQQQQSEDDLFFDPVYDSCGRPVQGIQAAQTSASASAGDLFEGMVVVAPYAPQTVDDDAWMDDCLDELDSPVSRGKLTAVRARSSTEELLQELDFV